MRNSFALSQYRYCVESLSHESALKISYYKGLLVFKLAKFSHFKTSMMIVKLSEDQTRAQFKTLSRRIDIDISQLTVSCINSQKNVTVSSIDADLSALKLQLNDEKVFTRNLMVEVDYHFSYMHEVSVEYLNLIEDLRKSSAPSKIIIMFSMTCEIVFSDDLCIDEY